MKSINLRGVKESLSDGEMKLVKGGQSFGGGGETEVGNVGLACNYTMRCDQSSTDGIPVTDCSRSTAVSTCGETAVGSGSVVCVQTGSC